MLLVFCLSMQLCSLWLRDSSVRFGCVTTASTPYVCMTRLLDWFLDCCFSGLAGSAPKLCQNVFSQCGRHKRLCVGRSSIHGWGAFALEPVEKNDFIYEYTGELISQVLLSLLCISRVVVDVVVDVVGVGAVVVAAAADAVVGVGVGVGAVVTVAIVAIVAVPAYVAASSSSLCFWLTMV